MILTDLDYGDLQDRELDPLWDGFPDTNGKKVFIKPNLVSPPNRWDFQSCTNVEVVRAVLHHIKESGDIPETVVIGDCGFKDQWESTLAVSDYGDLEKKYPLIKIIPLQDGPNFHKFTLQRIEGYISLYGAKLSNYLLESDVVINLPKLKVHSMALITGAIKNMMGTMIQKGSMHPKGDAAILHKRLRDLYVLMKDRVSWTLMDGIVGSEYCEQQGIPVETGLLISGTDMWEVDCLAAQVMGIAPSEVGYLSRIGNDKGNGYPLLPKNVKVTSFERPLAFRKRRI